MRNFLRIAQGVDVMPLLSAVTRNDEIWDRDALRTKTEGTPHGEVSDIWLRYSESTEVKDVVSMLESKCFPAWSELPQARSIIFDLMRRVEGTRLGHVLITRLKPGGKISPHVDAGQRAAYYSRYHVVLQNGPGSVFRAGSEIVTMLSGEVWWFDNAVHHEVVNNSNDDRITMILDIRSE